MPLSVSIKEMFPKLEVSRNKVVLLISGFSDGSDIENAYEYNRIACLCILIRNTEA